MRYIVYRLDHGSQVGNSNSEEFPFYTSKNPEGKASGVFAVHENAYAIYNNIRCAQRAGSFLPARFLTKT